MGIDDNYLKRGDKVLAKGIRGWVEGIYVGICRYPKYEDEIVVSIESWTGKLMDCVFPRESVRKK